LKNADGNKFDPKEEISSGILFQMKVTKISRCNFFAFKVSWRIYAVPKG